MGNADLKKVLAELRRRLATLYGSRLARIVLFGSYARGDAEPGSDIDVLSPLLINIRREGRAA